MSDLLSTLNEAQRSAVTHNEKPLLIVAGAGTGKTTVLTRRYAHLLEQQKLKPDQILAVTFTEKAATELEDRIVQLLPTGTYDFWISTFHGLCLRILEDHALEIGLPTEFRLLTSTDAWLLLRRKLSELPLDHYRPLGNPTKFLRGLLQHISRAKDEGIMPETYLSFVQNLVLDGDAEVVLGEKKRLQELADLFFAYRHLMLEEGSLDFGDLILETLRLFRERPLILKKYQEQFHYILVDEFQDTNWAQYELIKLLAGTRQNLTVVGDDDQAIYKFRGASLANILQFRDDFPDVTTVALTQNYRSHKEILDAAYSFIKHNDPNRLEVRLKDTGLTKELEAVRGEGGTVDMIWRRRVEDEAEAVADAIKHRKNIEPETSWNEFAILVRSNDSAEPFVRVFERLGIPFQFLALRGLYTKPVVLDVVALLSLCDGYHESAAVWRAMNLPCYAFSARDIAELLHYANRKGISLWQGIRDAAERTIPETELTKGGVKSAGKLVADVEGLAEAARRHPPLRVLQQALEKTTYLAWLVRQPEDQKRESLQNLNAFAGRVRRYEQASHDPSLRGFLEEFHLETESGEEGALDMDPDAGPEVVKILTVHASKGLEFKHVFVVSVVDQRFPSRARSESIPLPDGLVKERLPEGDVHLEEERRLFYVAMTRAKDTLTITGASDYGGSREKKPSVFIEEAGLTKPEPFVSIADDTKQLMSPEEVSTSKETGLGHYELKKRFSFTQLAAFRKCPLQYKFEHIYRIPKLGNWNKTFGQSLHACFQQMLELHLMRGQLIQPSLFGGTSSDLTEVTEGGFRVTEDEALSLFEKTWKDEWYDSRAHHDECKSNGRQAVRHFWKACAKEAPKVLELEKSFILVLGKHSLKGAIDRVDQLPDGTVAIMDYKTGKAKEALQTEDKEQLYLYQIALEERGIKVGKLTYVYVLDWKTIDVDLLVGKARENFLDKMTERMDAVAKSDFAATPDANACRYCDFRSICEFRKG